MNLSRWGSALRAGLDNNSGVVRPSGVPLTALSDDFPPSASSCRLGSHQGGGEHSRGRTCSHSAET